MIIESLFLDLKDFRNISIGSIQRDFMIWSIFRDISIESIYRYFKFKSIFLVFSIRSTIGAFPMLSIFRKFSIWSIFAKSRQRHSPKEIEKKEFITYIIYDILKIIIFNRKFSKNCERIERFQLPTSRPGLVLI